MHPLLQRDNLHAHAVEHDYALVAYSLLSPDDVFDVPEIVDIAEDRDASPARDSLAWLLGTENVHVIPKATGEDHLRDNLGGFDLELDAAEVARIESIDGKQRYVDRDVAPWPA